jgi:hypothetical protein
MQSESKYIIDFVNKIIKRCVYEMDYKQLGKLPKFFNPHKSQESIEEYNLFVWRGYTCQVKLFNDGLFLNIEASSRFVNKQTVLDRINELRRSRYSDSEISKLLTPKYDES